MTEGLPGALDELLFRQCNVVTHEQAVRLGPTRHEIATLVRKRHWQRLHRGVFYVGTGPVPREARLWGAVWRVGHGGVLSHETAAEVWKFADAPSTLIHVSVPRTAGRLPASEGIRLHYSARLPLAGFTGGIVKGILPLTWGHETVLDLAGTSATAEDAVNWAIRACQRGTTTPEDIRRQMPRHPRLQWREELAEALAEIRAGVQSPLERRYLLNVEA